MESSQLVRRGSEKQQRQKYDGESAKVNRKGQSERERARKKIKKGSGRGKREKVE